MKKYDVVFGTPSKKIRYESHDAAYFLLEQETGNNRAVFDELGIGSERDCYEFAESVYGYRATGLFPTARSESDFAKIINKLKTLWLNTKGPGSFVTINGTSYTYEDSIRVGELLSRGDKRKLNVDGEILTFTVTPTYLSFDNHHSSCEHINQTLAKFHGLTLVQVAEDSYGYSVSAFSQFPEYKGGDYEAATKVYKKLKMLLVGGTEEEELVEPSVEIEEKTLASVDKIDEFGYPIKRFKRGDFVEVLEPTRDRKFPGWKNVWVRGMGYAVGNTYEVVTDAHHNGVLLKDAEGNHALYTYPHQMLRLTEDVTKSKPKVHIKPTIDTNTLDFDIPVVI